jgi:hypothetical protein
MREQAAEMGQPGGELLQELSARERGDLCEEHRPRITQLQKLRSPGG